MYKTVPIVWIVGTIIVLLNSGQTEGHPIDRVADNKLELKDETRYPNGTVVGKYSYTDGEGNPVNVKYYADESSYGVELNRFKIFNSTIKHAQQPMPLNILDYHINPMEPLLDLASEVMNFPKSLEEKIKPNAIEKKTEISKNSKLGHSHSPKSPVSPDYETFYQNEVKAPKQCEKEKVRVYLTKEKRKTRSVFVDDEASKYCERF